MARLEDHSRWGISEDLWLDIGDDFVFICRSPIGEERWFRLRQDYANSVFDAACGASSVWDGILAAYQVGLGPWGQEPWNAPDFHAVVEALSRASGRLAGDDPDVAVAHQELLSFLRYRCVAGDHLVVDDGSGETNRFPAAEPGWTETGEPLTESTLVKYLRDHEIFDPFVTFPVLVDHLEALAMGIPEVAAFLADSTRPYTQLGDLSVLLREISGLSPVPTDLYSFVKEAHSSSAVLLLQSAGRFPLAVPRR